MIYSAKLKAIAWKARCLSYKFNTGDKGKGDKETGDKRTGDKKTGDKETGDKETGDKGTCNKGTWETVIKMTLLLTNDVLYNNVTFEIRESNKSLSISKIFLLKAHANLFLIHHNPF